MQDRFTEDIGDVVKYGSPRADPGELDPDPVIEAYKRCVDRTLLRQNLRLSPTERVQNLMALQQLTEEARRAGQEKDG